MKRCTCSHPEYYEEHTPTGIIRAFNLPCVRITILRMAKSEPLHGRYWQGRLYLTDCPHNQSILTREDRAARQCREAIAQLQMLR